LESPKYRRIFASRKTTSTNHNKKQVTMTTATNKKIDFVVNSVKRGYYTPKGAFIASRYGEIEVTTTYYKDGSVEETEKVIF